MEVDRRGSSLPAGLTMTPARDLRGKAQRQRRWVAVGAIAIAGALAGVGLSSLELAPDATNRLRDDAFYQFAWASNLATGRGPTVSDGVTTSGVQLLWSLLLVPIAWLFGPAMLPLIAPWLGFALHAAAAVVWGAATRSRLVGVCLAACWLGQPLLLRESQNGQETALACLLASLLWLRRRSGNAGFTVLAVLAVLARTELLAIVALLSWWRHRGCWPRALLAPALAFAVHAAANMLLGGGPWPDAALPMPWLVHNNRALVDGSLAAFVADAWWFGRPVLLGGPWAMASAAGSALAVFLLLRRLLRPGQRLVPLGLVGVAYGAGASDLAVPLGAATLLAFAPPRGRRPMPRDLLALAIGLAAIPVLHWAVRWYPRDYYAAPLAVLAFAASQRVGRCRLLLLVVVAAMLGDRWQLRPEPLADQSAMLLAGRWLSVALPAEERVGCFNSGIVTFHAAVLADGRHRRGVVNLDGVVDARAFAALREGRLGAWLDELGVRFVLDHPVQFARDPRLLHACGHWIAPDFDAEQDLLEVARFAVPGSEAMRLYWRRGRGEPPPTVLEPRLLGRDARGTVCVVWPAAAGQTLLLEVDGGERRPLLSVDVATSVVVAIPLPAGAAGRLYVAGANVPVMVLAPQ